MAQRLSGRELHELLSLDVPLRLATLGPHGYPRITPLWFLYEDGAFHMTSVEGRSHLRDLAREPRISLCVDTETRVTESGGRMNRRVKAYGRAELLPDEGGRWTVRITRKYVHGPEGEALAARRAAVPRLVIRVRPKRLLSGRGP